MWKLRIKSLGYGAERSGTIKTIHEYVREEGKTSHPTSLHESLAAYARTPASHPLEVKVRAQRAV